MGSEAARLAGLTANEISAQIAALRAENQALRQATWTWFSTLRIPKLWFESLDLAGLWAQALADHEQRKAWAEGRFRNGRGYWGTTHEDSESGAAYAIRRIMRERSLEALSPREQKRLLREMLRAQAHAVRERLA